MLGFCVIAPLADATAKLLGQAVPLDEVLLFRFGIQALVLIPLIFLGGRAWRMRGMVLWLRCSPRCGICRWPMRSRSPL